MAYLLACDPEKTRGFDRQRISYLVRAATLTELAQRGLITDQDGRVRAAGESAADPVLDEMLARIAGGKPRTWRSWVRKDRRGALPPVERMLRDQDRVDVEVTKVLGLFPHHRVTVTDPGSVRRLRALVDDALRGEAEPSGVDQRVAALTALAAAVDLRGVIRTRDRWHYRQRIDELQDRAGGAIPALRKVFRELRAARAAAASGGSG